MQRLKILYSAIRCTKIYAEANIENAQSVVHRLWMIRVAVSIGKANLYNTIIKRGVNIQWAIYAVLRT